MEISELFIFASFRKVRFLKFGNFLEITGFFELAKILQKKFRNNFLFLSQKNLFLGQKVWKSSETGFSEHSEFTEFSEIVLF